MRAEHSALSDEIHWANIGYIGFGKSLWMIFHVDQFLTCDSKKNDETNPSTNDQTRE